MASNDFYDVQDFLADGQKVSCRFETDVSNLGYLEGSADKHIRAGTTLELPLWLALPIESFASILLPPAYGSRTRNALAASANSVNLKNLGGGGGSFYAVGNKIGSIIEGDVLQTTLDNAFRTRITEVMDQSQHTSADSGGEGAAYEFCQGLDQWERQLFLIGEQSAKEMRAWSEVKAKKGSAGAGR